MRSITAFVVFFLFGFSALAQQDCSTAIPVCQSTYYQASSYIGFGTSNELNFPGNSTCLQGNEENSVWYIFTVNVSGSLEFQILPNVILDDYDWALYNLTGTDCSGIISGSAVESRCNYSANPGSTGLSNPYLQTSVPAGGPNQCAPLNVVVGETYVLIINNHAGSTTGYTLNFGGTAGIFDATPPSAVSIDPFPCTPPDTLFVNLSEPILCSTLAADGSDFYVTGPAPASITGAYSLGCVTGLFSSQIILPLLNPLAVNGTYTLRFSVGSDGNTLLDNCGNAISTSDSLNFKVALADAQFTYTIIKTCNGDSVLFQDISIGDTANAWVWDFGDGGSSFLSDPSHLYPNTGTYTVHLAMTDTGGCFNNDSLVINTYVEAPYAEFQYNPQVICAGNNVYFDAPNSTGQGIVYDWDFGNGDSYTSQGPDTSYSYPSNGTFTVILSVIDSIGCVDTASAVLNVDSLLQADFTYTPPFACAGTPIQFTDQSLGGPVSWSWDFGNGQTSAIPSPSMTFNTQGTYDVILIINNGVCAPDTFDQSLTFYEYPVVNLGDDTMICIGESVVLDAGNPGTVYSWSTGETTQTIFIDFGPQLISVLVDNNGCKTIDSIFVDSECALFIPNAFTPNGDGINDVFQVIQKNLTNFHLSIFNRWGEMVFTTTDPDLGWDGTNKGLPEEIGTYIYSVSAFYVNEKPVVKAGNITLLR